MSRPDATLCLAEYVAGAQAADLPEPVRKEVARALLNWVGVAIGASRHETIEIALRAIAPFAGPPQATVLGRTDRLDIMNAAMLNGISSHVFDFDDTDLRTTVHPSAPVAPALLALAEHRGMSGADFVLGMALGIEAECRIARAVMPPHQAIGWHPTGTCGVFGAAVATGKALGLDAHRMAHAISLAATQPVGIREMFGSMTKSFHPGRAAQSGMLSALLAEQGYTSSEAGIEAKRGWANVVSTRQDYTAITDGLGESFEIMRNSYKPYACGLVVHPVIDGCIRLRTAHRLTPSMIARIDVDVHPIVMELTAKRTPSTGLEGKFSVYYAAAIGILAGVAGEPEFSDDAVRVPAAMALRDKVVPRIDEALRQDQARVRITLTDGRVLEQFVEHAVGSLHNPMTDAQLEGKFRDLVAGIIPADRIGKLIDLCWTVGSLTDAGDIARAAAA
jgi:2-methylcitrate dehydratase PrpD